MAVQRSKSTSYTKFDQAAVVESNLDIALKLNTAANVVVTLNICVVVKHLSVILFAAK